VKPLTILKIGGSIITHKDSKKPKIHETNLKRISKEIASIHDRDYQLIIVHGAGSYGHPIVKKTGIDKGIQNEEQRVAFAETQRLQNELNLFVTKYLIKEGLPAIPCQISSFVVLDSGRINEFDTSAIEGLLEINMIPVLYGVPAYDRNQGCSILSGDQIVSYLALKLRANRIIHGTDVDGIFTENPKLSSSARLIHEISSKNLEEVMKKISGSTNTDVTGGMFGKLSELLEVGIESQIINALVPGNITKALRGENIGTMIRF